jgi:O-glycosyl hydrolase
MLCGRSARGRGFARARVRGLTALAAGLVAVAAATPVANAATPSGTATAAAGAPAQVLGAAQTIDGFGASGAWWVNDLAHFGSATQNQVANLLFTGNGIALSQYRYNIGGGGVGVSVPARAPQTFLTSSGTYDWTRDPGGRTFLGLAAADHVPDLIGFVNSAPPQYTTDNAGCGGQLTPADESAYGDYLATVIAHFAAQGITLDRISPMNEPDNSFFTCGQEGMAVPASQRAAVIDAVGAALSPTGLPTTVIADESSQTGQLLSEAPTWLGDPSAPGYVSAIAHHTYDNPGDVNLQLVSALGSLHAKTKWATEICCQVTGNGGASNGYGAQYDPTIGGGLVLATIIYRDLTLADDSAFQWWTALSSELGCDPTADSACATTTNSNGWNDGLIYYDPNYAGNGDQNLYVTKRFYVLGQYSRYVRPGAVRYAIGGAPAGVQAMAFWQHDAWTVVVSNTTGASTPFALDLGSGAVSPQGAYRTSATENLAAVAAPSVSGSTMSTTLPAQSVSTFVLGSAGQPGSTGPAATALVGAQSGLCLDVPGSTPANRTRLDLAACTGAVGQRFTMTASGTITVGGLCLDGYQRGTAPGTVVEAFTCNGGDNQRWELHPNGTVTSAQSGLCLDVLNQSTSPGAQIDEWTCNGGGNQVWTRS